MTARRNLKRLVRDRMRATGESYSTAYRRVTGTPVTHHHRESALVRRMLDAAGVDLSEPVVCGLGGGIGFLYAVFEYEAVDHPLLTIVTQHHPTPWLDAVAEHLGVVPETVTSTSAERAMIKMDALLDTGRPVLVSVGRGLLPWHDDVSAVEAADAYPVLVIGRLGDELSVVDEQQEQIPRDQFSAAWAAHRKGRFALRTLPESISAARIDLDAAVQRATQTTYRHLTGPVLGNSFDVNFGLSGIERLQADLADSRSRRGWRRRFGSGRAFEVGMIRMSECLTWAHGSRGATRPVYAQFLREVGRTDAAARAEESGRMWSAIADLTAAAVERTTVRPEMIFEDLADRVASVLEVERGLVDALS